MIELLDLDATIARLAELSALRANVHGAVVYAKAIRGGVKAVPAAYVLPLGDRPQPNPYGNQLVQHDTVTRVGVVLAVQNLRDPRGAFANKDLVVLRNAVLEQLLAWSPQDGFGGFEWAGGALLDLDDQVLFWQDDFTTQYVIRSI